MQKISPFACKTVEHTSNVLREKLNHRHTGNILKLNWKMSAGEEGDASEKNRELTSSRGEGEGESNFVRSSVRAGVACHPSNERKVLQPSQEITLNKRV